MDNIIIYNTDDGAARVSLYANDGTVWLTQAQISELFNKEVSTISRHIANIFDEHEVEEKSNLRFMQIANSDKPVAFYSLNRRRQRISCISSGTCAIMCLANEISITTHEKPPRCELGGFSVPIVQAGTNA